MREGGFFFVFFLFLANERRDPDLPFVDVGCTFSNTVIYALFILISVCGETESENKTGLIKNGL